MELFKLGDDSRREACGRLLDQIYYSLCSVTINVPDYETLQLMQATRRLYQPQSRQLSTFELLEVTRRFIKGYLTFKDHPKIRQLMNAIIEYNKVLKHFSLFDHQVRTFQLSRLGALARFSSQLLLLILYSVALLPAFLLNLPALLLIDWISKKKAKRAVATSTVKLKGRDVLATWKLMVGFVLFPLMYISYSLPMAYRMSQNGYTAAQIAGIIMILSCILFPCLSYVAIKVAEHGYEAYLSIRPLWYSVSRPHYAEVIRNLRHRLKMEIIRAVDEFGPKLIEDFEKTRIVPARRKSMNQVEWSDAMESVKSPRPIRPPTTITEEGIEGLDTEQDEDSSGKDGIADIIERAKSISRESSPLLGFEGLDSVMNGFQYMRAGVHAAISSVATSSSLGGPHFDDWSYVEPVEIDDIFFTKSTVPSKDHQD